MGAALDLSQIDVGDDEEALLIAANSMPTSTYASVRVTSQTPPSLPSTEQQAFAMLVGKSSANNVELAAIARELEPMQKLLLSNIGMNILQFYGVRVDRIGGRIALVVEYKRSGLNGPVFVQINRIFAPDQEINLNLSYRESEKVFWKPVLGRIRSSFQIVE
ncbi:MAG: hypothetical protein M3Q08_04350 [Pseudomonadota bacterium]|nr:hypothetical protein [Pseudomonadota bacterium]